MGIKKIKKQLILSALFSLVLTGLPASSAMTPEANTLYQQACSAEYQQDYKTAEAKLIQALNIAKDDPMLMTKLAGIYSDTDQYDKALEIYNKVLQIRPDDAFVYISVGSIYENQGKYIEALQAYNKAMEIFPNYKYNFLNIANVQYQLRDYKSAIENYNQFLSTYAQHWEARENLANSYLANSDFEKAVSEYDILYSKNTAAFKDFANYGLALFETKKYDKAAEMLERAVANDPDNTSAHVSLALSYQQLEKNDLALAQYDEVFKQAPNLYSIRLDYGNLLADLGRNDDAVASYKLYIEHYPKDARGYQNLGIVYKRQKNFDSAIENFEKTLILQAGKKNLPVMQDLAECYHLKKDYPNALKYYNAVLASKPNDYDLKLNKALVLHAMKNYNEAIALYTDLLKTKESESVQNNLTSALIAQGYVFFDEQNYSLATGCFERAIERKTKDSGAYFGLAKSYRACGMNDKAAEFYEKAISMAPEKKEYSAEYTEFIASSYKPDVTTNSTDVKGISEVKLSMEETPDAAEKANLEHNKNLIAIGDENYKKKNYDVAIKNYQDALQINPNDAETLLKLGNIYKMRDDNTNAQNFYKKAVVVNPNYADGWFNLGLVYANTNNLSGAKESFHRVITLDPNYGYAYYALAIAYEQDGNKQEAIKNYKIFLVHNKDAATANVVQDRIKELSK